MTRGHHRSGLRVITMIAILVVVSGSYLGHLLPYLGLVHGQQAAVASVDPPFIASTSLTSGSVSFNVNISNAPSINSFYVALIYDSNVLSNPSIDYTGNVLGGNVQVLKECIDGLFITGLSNGCNSWDAKGVVSIGLFLYSSNTTAPTSGPLFKVTFGVGPGFSPLHLFHVVIGNGSNGNVASPLPISTNDGYFTNLLCGAKLCTPPVPNFTYSPTLPSVGHLTTFNASTSRATNSGTKIQSITWDFGDQSGLQFNKTNSAFPIITHNYGQKGNESVTLRVNDTAGAAAYQTLLVPVINIFIELAIQDLSGGSVAGGTVHNLLAGAVVAMNMTVENSSTQAETAKINATVRGILLYNNSFVLQSDSRRTVGFNWDTSGYPPDIYQILGQVAPVPGQNVTSHDALTFYVELVYPLVTGSLSLGLFSAVGLGFLVILGGGLAASRILASSARKKRALLDAEI